MKHNNINGNAITECKYERVYSIWIINETEEPQQNQFIRKLFDPEVA